MKNKTIKNSIVIKLYKIISFILIILLWNLYSLNTNTILPSTLDIFNTFIESISREDFFIAIFDSIRRVLSGFILALIFGLIMCFSFGIFPKTKLIFSFVIEILRPIPPIAWIPISIIIFGISDHSAYFVIFIGALFPIISNTELGILQIEKKYFQVAQIFQKSFNNTMVHIIIPSSLPYIFTGFKIALGFSWMVVVAAEMISSNSGLGYEIQLSRQLLRLDNVILYMLVIGLICFLMMYMLDYLQTKLMPWKDRDTKIQLLPNINQQSLDFLSKNEQNHNIYLKDISFSYNNNKIIDSLSLDIHKNEIIIILGQSGVGKSTLLNLIAGFKSLESGSIYFGSKKLANSKCKLGFLFQDISIFPWKSVKDNVAYGFSEHFTDLNIYSLLKLVGFNSNINAYPHMLSGGQKQRVALARTLANNPDLLLMDEPFTGIDMITKEKLQDDFLDVFSKKKTTVIMVTHDISEAVFMADKILIMHKKGIEEINNLHIKEIENKRDSNDYYQQIKNIRNKLGVNS